MERTCGPRSFRRTSFPPTASRIQQLNTVVNLGAGADFQLNAGEDALMLGSKARRTYAGDLRVELTRDTSGSVDIAAGLMYEFERWGYDGIAESGRPADQAPVSVSHPRINTCVRYSRRISPGVRFLFMNYRQARTDHRFDEPRIASSLFTGVAITDRISLPLAFNSICDFAPIVPIRHFYFDISNGIVVKI
ncbi:MAG TPA: hypothetical protein VJO14_04220 [Bacteroidota bacterium]|nr:hypothetical protein [Bacteroidota bacterium]